jgi:O-antigen ligase
MQRSIDCADALPQPRRWVRQTPATATGGDAAPKNAFRLAILFLIILYSNVAVIYPQLNALRPALVVALLGLGLMVIETAQSGGRYRLMAPQGILLMAILVFGFLGSFEALWPRLAFEKTSDILKIVLIYVLLENTVTTEKRLHTILWTMVLGGMMPALGIINNYMHGILVEGTRGAWRGVFANPNEAAYALVILVPIAFSLVTKSGFFMKLVLAGIMATYLVAIFFTYSRGSLLGLFAIIALLGWKQKSYVIKAVMIAGLIGSLFLVGMYWNREQNFNDVNNDTTYNQRIATIKAGINMFKAYPIFGVGPGCSIVGYALFVPPEDHCGCQLQLSIHNTPVQALSELGLAGFVPFVLFIGLSIFHAWRMRKGPMATYAVGLELAIWGFVVCGMSGGYSYSWFPYILIALVVACRHIAATKAAESTDAAAAV